MGGSAGSTEELSIEQLIGRRTGILRALRVPPGTGLTGKVHQSGRAEWVDDYLAGAEITREIAVHEERQRSRPTSTTAWALLFAIGAGMADLADAASADPDPRARLDRLRRQAADATTVLRESLRTLRSSPAALALGVALRADCARAGACRGPCACGPDPR
ncbi:hypothetical protein [Streptomyces sp. NPDC127197]|uniref:hypothetical protein n=1 Tax=Streptomyces sp. NPDC127197 TaxID=3345388 RepID=UPI00364249E6